MGTEVTFRPAAALAIAAKARVIPAEYGNSGAMTVNHDGKIFEKNLGKDTASSAKT
jgi:hypothetical protein